MGITAAILAGAGIQGATSLIGGGKGASAATQAANIQAQAARQSLQLQADVQQRNFNLLQPFVGYGTDQLGTLQSALPRLITPIDTSLPSFTFKPTMEELANTPGYQFTLGQGLEAEQARIAAMGLGSSGSAIRGAGQFATGLAAQTWPEIFNAEQSIYQTNANALLAGRTMNLQQRQQILNMINSQAQLGLSAGGALAGANLQSAGAMSSAVQGVGAAQASGVVGSTNALVGGLTGAGNAMGGGITSSAFLPLILQNAGGVNTLGIRQDPGLAYMQNPSFNIGETP